MGERTSFGVQGDENLDGKAARRDEAAEFHSLLLGDGETCSLVEERIVNDVDSRLVRNQRQGILSGLVGFLFGGLLVMEARGKRQEARGKRQEARGKRQEARGKRQEARGKR